jgi:hypothetical protein
MDLRTILSSMIARAIGLYGQLFCGSREGYLPSVEASCPRDEGNMKSYWSRNLFVVVQKWNLDERQ